MTQTPASPTAIAASTNTLNLRSQLALKLTGEYLLIPAQEVANLDSADNIVYDSVTWEAPALGAVYFNQQAYPIYALDDDLQLLATNTDKTSFGVVVLLNEGGHLFALRCASAQLVTVQLSSSASGPDDLRLLSLPTCMISDRMPFDRIALYNNAVALCTRRENLWRHLLSLGVGENSEIASSAQNPQRHSA